MNRLPSEIQQSIFVLLPRETILECTLVCRRWTQTAQESLHSYVRIDTKEGLDIFMNHINIETSRRNQVKDFRLFIKPLVYFDKRSVCDLFPNLQSVDFIQFEGDKTLADFSNKVIDTTNMISTLENVVEQGDYQFSFHLMESHLCERLCSLFIRYTPESGQNIINHLKNMPVLKVLRLDLRNFTLALDDLERIHQKIPTLIDVNLAQANLVQNKMLVDVRPMPLVKKMVLSFRYTMDPSYLTESYIRYFQYILKKYTHLENLMMYLMEYENVTIDDRNRVFDSGWIPLLQSIGPQLVSIGDIYVPANVNIFKKLDGFKCKIQRLSILSTQSTLTLDEFTQSNQSKYIRDLTMDGVILHLNDSLRDTKLVKLNLSLIDDDATLILNHFFKICPDTLKYLSLESYVVEYDKSDDYQCLSLISLDVNRNYVGMVGDGVEENVYKCCPNLKELYIECFSKSFFV